MCNVQCAMEEGRAGLEAIVAVYGDWGIGAAGTQPVVLKADRRHFRELTAGAAVLVGRRTLADFPGGKPLKGRRNLVLSRSLAAVEGAEVFQSPAEALAALGEGERCLVIGGASVYLAMLPHIDRIYATKIELTPHSDTFFPDLDRDPAFVCVEEGELREEDGVAFRFCVYERRQEHFPNPQL